MAREWTQISSRLYRTITESGSTTAVPKDQWPARFEEEAEPLELWGWKSTEADRAEMRMVRDGDDIPEEWKAYRYILKQEDGETFMSPPLKDIPEMSGHHTDHIPAWRVRADTTPTS